MKKWPLLATLMLVPLPALAQIPANTTVPGTITQKPVCGGDFSVWVDGITAEARAAGVSTATLRQLQQAAVDEKVLGRDRSQTGDNTSFTDFARRLVSDSRLQAGRENLMRYKAVFDKAEETYGIPGPVIAAIWGMETDFGADQGTFNTLNALLTLAYDCRRPGLFRPQFIALLKLFDLGFADAATTGTWAGTIGQMQLLPGNCLEYGIDGDGDGRVDLKNSVPDAIMTTAHMLQKLGWKKNQPWLEEASFARNSLPWQEARPANRKSRAEWAKHGVTVMHAPADSSPGTDRRLKASLLLPMGHKGPAFFAYSNFDVLMKWNRSYLQATTLAYFATRLAGAPAFKTGTPDPGLTRKDMKRLRQKLAERGYDTSQSGGGLDPIPREAVRQEQIRLKLPADSWPTKELLDRLTLSLQHQSNFQKA